MLSRVSEMDSKQLEKISPFYGTLGLAVLVAIHVKCVQEVLIHDAFAPVGAAEKCGCILNLLGESEARDAVAEAPDARHDSVKRLRVVL